ncbi:hypothetical protein ACS0TY_012689 [Phlomoides rotata]
MNTSDFYAVLGLKKECTPVDLRNAYKKLAMKWHPDRCSASGNPEEAKKKFQDVQQAYSVLSDANKRFLYDVGVYDENDDDDENGMGDFLNEMASMMSQTTQNENRRNESFEDLQQLFEEIFHSDNDALGCSSGTSNKRNSSDMSSSNFSIESTQFEGLSIGAGHRENIKLGERTQGGNGNRRGGRKQKISSGQDVSSGISAS